MSAKTFWADKFFLFTLAAALLLAGCTPPGPRALLDGKRLLDAGRAEEAVEKLKTATSLMSTNAQAWNYLGLACHLAGKTAEAENAYLRAVTLDRSLIEARFNLGCLFLDENKVEAAKGEFTACTLRRANEPGGWVKLGEAQLRGRDLAAAEKSFGETLRLSPLNGEALNGLGLVQLQRNHPRDAAAYFAGALKQQPDFRPALLNLATVLQMQLNDRAGALKRYREYLALTPRAENWDAVNTLADSLEQPAAPKPKPAAPATNFIVAYAAPPASAPAPQVNVPRPAQITRPEPAKPAPAYVAPANQKPPEVVQVAPEPVIRTTPEISAPAKPAEPVVANPVPTISNTSTAKAEPAAKRGFFTRVTHLFGGGEPKPAPAPVPKQVVTEAKPAVKSAAPAPTPRTFARYNYLSPAKPAAGNRADAERALARGVQWQAAKKPADALAAFRESAQLDGSFFEAHYKLGLAEFDAGRLPESLAAWEHALAVRPDSSDARYNFSLALKAAAHPVDAADELERILAANADETRAHLVLGNLCANELQDRRRAREHYIKVLDLNPRHPQASAIRYWLVANAQ